MDDFEEQLKQQQIAEERRKLEEEGVSDPYTYTDPSDGTVYEWDTEKNAWFPKIDDDFIAKYQANYGVHNENTETKETNSTASSSSKPQVQSTSSGEASKSDDKQHSQQDSSTGKGHKRKGDEGWFELEDSKNRNVYVSGLPEDITPDEYLELMSKCGIIMEDDETQEPKLKLYTDHQGNRKGDGRCCYLKRESVELALQILDGSELRGHKIHVELAKFTPKGNYNPAMKKKKKKKKKEKSHQEKLLAWKPERNKMMGDARKRHETVVILKNMFDPKEFEEDPMAINEIRDDLQTECGKFGEVKKVIIFDRHPDGVASVKFKEAEEADMCIASLNGRWFAKNRILAVRWDGTTDYQIEETQKERDQRLQQWETFLVKGEKKPGNTDEAENNDKSGNTDNSGNTDKSGNTDTAANEVSSS